MLLARIIFADDKHSVERETLKDVAETYLATLLRNGHIHGDYFVAWSSGTLTAFTHVARPDALDEGHHSEWSLRDLNAVARAFGRRPECTIIDDDIPKEYPEWQSYSSLYLFTHAFDEASPVCCGDTGRPIPLYLLPISQDKREAIYFWSRSYNYHDNVWLESSTLEIPAYTQLADPTSDLSTKGRELCRVVEQVTKTQTFYYMQRYWGRIDGEALRPCPVCGGPWHLSEVATDDHPFHQFHFRCVRCRIVSHCGDSYDNEQNALIGDYNSAT